MKDICRHTPVSLYDTQALEGWLEKMALRGLYVKELHSVFSVFTRGEPRPTRYRAEPMPASGPSIPKPMVELYRDFGGELVLDTQDAFLLFSTQDPNAPEPHSDPALQGALWRKRYKVKRRQFSGFLTWFALYHILSFLNLSQSNIPLSVTLLLIAPLELVLLTFAVLTAALHWSDLRWMSRVIRKLEAGEPLDRQAAPTGPYRLNLAMFAANLVLLAAVLCLILGNHIGNPVRPLEELSGFPVLSLAEMEGEGYTSRPLLIPKGFDEQTRQPIFRDYGNYFRRTWYPPVSVHLHVLQSGLTARGDRVSLSIDRYALTLPFSSFAARELLDRAIDLSPGDWTVEEIAREDVSLLLLARQSCGTQLAAAAKGNRALLVRCGGQRDLAEYLSELTAMVGEEEIL